MDPRRRIEDFEKLEDDVAEISSYWKILKEDEVNDEDLIIYRRRDERESW